MFIFNENEKFFTAIFNEPREHHSLKVANIQREEFNCQRRQAQDTHYETINVE